MKVKADKKPTNFVATKMKHHHHHKEFPYRNNAWNDEQHSHSNTNEYEAETANPTRYQFPAGSYLQTKHKKHRKDAANGQSELVPYTHRDHAWTPDQHANSNTDEFDEETKVPEGYQKMLEDHKHHSKPIKGWTGSGGWGTLS